MLRKHYISKLLEEFLQGMLPSIAANKASSLQCMEKAHIRGATTGLPVEFELCRMFDAVWIWSLEQGVELPKDSDWNKDFKEFCRQLMHPWPHKIFQENSLEIRLTHKSNGIARYRYTISSI